jgi:RNA polymerase sigma-70 factor (ECF subfamily)
MTEDDAKTVTSADARWTTLRAVLARAVRRQCPAWLRDHADDLAQAALMKIMSRPQPPAQGDRAQGDEGERSLSSFYLYRVAHSALVDEIRRRQRRREVPLEAPDSGEPRDDAEQGGGERLRVALRTSSNPEQDTSLRELGTSVRACLLAMKQERRLAVMLYIQGHSVPEAARILDWPAKRTENLVYRGLADLRQCLLSKGHTP